MEAKQEGVQICTIRKESEITYPASNKMTTTTTSEKKNGWRKRAFSSIKDTMAHKKKFIALQSISGGYFDVNTTYRKGVMPTFYKTLGYN